MSPKRSGKSRSSSNDDGEEDDEDEVLSPDFVLLDGSGTRGPATRMRRAIMPPWAVEDRASGEINCPSGAHGIIVNLRACNLQICYGCDPWVGFCFYCKQVLCDGIACSSCHHRVSPSHIKALNDATKGSSEDEDEDRDKGEDEEAANGMNVDAKDAGHDNPHSGTRPAKRTRRRARAGLQSKGKDTESAIDVDDDDS